MKKIFYLLAVEGGVEPCVKGPYQTEEERDCAAQEIHEEQEEDDGLFWVDIDDSALTVGSYHSGFFWDD